MYIEITPCTIDEHLLKKCKMKKNVVFESLSKNWNVWPGWDEINRERMLY